MVCVYVSVCAWLVMCGTTCAPTCPGTSLLQEVVYLVSQGADPDEIGLMNIDEQLPVLEYPQPGLDILKVAGSGDMGSGSWGFVDLRPGGLWRSGVGQELTREGWGPQGAGGLVRGVPESATARRS